LLYDLVKKICIVCIVQVIYTAAVINNIQCVSVLTDFNESYPTARSILSCLIY